MKILRHIYPLLLLTLLLQSCGSEADQPVMSQSPDPASGNGAYMVLRLSIFTASRANPLGGEDGDGREEGTANENRINNLTIFFYNHSDGLNAPDNTPIIHSQYCPDNLSITSGYYATDTIRLDNGFIPQEGDRIVIATNMGDISALSTLGEIKRHIVDTPLTPGEVPVASTGFTMASAYNNSNGDNDNDGYVYVTAQNGGSLDGSREHPYRATATIERTAARLDLWINRDADSNLPSEGQSDYLEYPVISPLVQSSLATVYVGHVIPVNAMQQGTWLLKHVTNSVSTDMSCFSALNVCGDELHDGSDERLPLNYVVEPHTISKTAATADALISQWYGNTSAAYLRANYGNGTIFTEANSLATLIPTKSDCHDGSRINGHTITLAYVNENTQHISQHDSRFITGLLFRCVYYPHTVYTSYTDPYNNTVDTRYTLGTTFYRYTPTRQDMDESYSIYFSTSKAATDYRDAHPDQLGTVTPYPDGICYYNLWLRHANNSASSPHTSCVMEYAIVRNNIYRVSVSFDGPGTPTPEIREPENIQFRIFVRRWYFRLQPTITM